MVLIILPNFSAGGAERVTINLANNLSYSKDVHLIVFNDYGPLRKHLSKNVVVHNLDKPSLRQSILLIIRLIKKLKPKVVFSSIGYINIATISIKTVFRYSFRTIIREANLPSISLKNNKANFLFKFLYKKLYPKANLILASSQRMKLEFINDFNINNSHINVINNPVDIKHIRKLAKEKINHPAFNISKEIIFITAGRLTVQKNHKELIDNFINLNKKNSRLLILGDGELKMDLKNYIQLKQVSDKVILLGYVENPWAWFSIGDAFLLSSSWEGMPNAALEALACGLPVIATPNCGGLPDLTTELDKDSLTISKMGDEFIHAMKKVKKINSFSSRKSLLPELFDVHHFVKKIGHFYNDLL